MASEDLMAYMAGQDGHDGDGMWGGQWMWIIVVFALLFGWGRNGLNGGTDGGLTRSELCEGFNFNDLQGSVRGIQQGICDSTFALNNTITNGFRGVDNAVCNLGYQTQQGFHGVDNAICNLGFQTQTGFNTLGAQLASCCCDIERGQDRISNQISNCCCDVERQIERGFCDTNANIAAQGRAIIDYLNNEKIDSLRAENQALRFSASQDRQNAYITTAMQAQTNTLIDRIAPYPVPSFNVCAPYHFGGWANGFGFDGGFGFGRGREGGCGCGGCC